LGERQLSLRNSGEDAAAMVVLRWNSSVRNVGEAALVELGDLGSRGKKELRITWDFEFG
jgi:hypothetical protein